MNDMNRTLLSVSYAMLALYGASAATPNTGYVDDDSYGATAQHYAPQYLKSAVVYQIVLRTFTREGNFKAATEKARGQSPRIH